MTLRTRSHAKHIPCAAFVIAASLTALAWMPGCSSDPAPPPEAYLTVTIGPGPQAPSDECNLASNTTWFGDIGAATGMKPTTVADGNTYNGAHVSVSCSVASSGDGFDVLASTTIEGTNGGSLNMSGHVTKASGGTDLSASFVSGTRGAFREATGCILTFAFQGVNGNGTASPTGDPVGGGRLWGHLSCPTEQDNSKPVSLADGGTTPRTCDGEADFFFDNCQ